MHPSTGRLTGYVACDVVSGEAYVADAEELTGIVWATPDTSVDYVPNGFAPAVQNYPTTKVG